MATSAVGRVHAGVPRAVPGRTAAEHEHGGNHPGDKPSTPNYLDEYNSHVQMLSDMGEVIFDTAQEDQSRIESISAARGAMDNILRILKRL